VIGYIIIFAIGALIGAAGMSTVVIIGLNEYKKERGLK